MKQKILLLFLAISSLFMNAQESEKKEVYGIKFSGFVKNDFILDSRQTVSARDGHFLLFPANENLDNDGVDKNDRANFNYLSIQSRLKGTISGPDAFGAKTSGVIEGAFFGQSSGDINGFRLRHAFIKLNWKSTELLMGQYWHMMFVTDCFPGTVSFNTGVPFQFLSRNPQIRLSHNIGNIKISGMAATQIDFASPGGPSVLRNSLLPDLNGQIQFSNNTSIYGGIIAGYKQVVPRLVTDSSYATTSKVGGISTQVYLKLKTESLTAKFSGTYSQNGYDGLMMGGYVIKSISDAVKDIKEYTTANTLTFWGDFHTNGKKIQGGLFIGYGVNMGTTDPVDDITKVSKDNTIRGYNIANLYRVSPRVIINSGKLRFAAEVEQTIAAYGKSLNTDGVPQDLTSISNTRLLVATYYFF